MSSSTFIIAEAGVNHNGSLDLALELVDVAARARADAVKFQTFNAGSLTTAHAEKASYQVHSTADGGTQLAMLKKLELSESDHLAIVARCRASGIRFMSTAFDSRSLRLLATLGMPAVKIPSGDITCAPLLLQAARLRMPLIVSTGMATLKDIENALGVIAFGLTTDRRPSCSDDFDSAYASAEGRSALESKVTLLHCVTQYPAPLEAVNLKAMDTMATAFGLPVGYSDHTLGIEVSLAAVARGATVIEKHFTLDRSMAGPDHAASLEPAELVGLVAGIRNIEQALGTSIKAPVPGEMANRLPARRSLVAAKPLRKGESFDEESLAFKRPGNGISPMDYWSLLGRPASRDFSIDDLIER